MRSDPSIADLVLFDRVDGDHPAGRSGFDRQVDRTRFGAEELGRLHALPAIDCFGRLHPHSIRLVVIKRGAAGQAVDLALKLGQAHGGLRIGRQIGANGQALAVTGRIGGGKERAVRKGAALGARVGAGLDHFNIGQPEGGEPDFNVAVVHALLCGRH